jgi:hypothetical protein
MTMQEGDQDDIPYIGRLNGHKYLMVIPGRSPICFPCARAGHLRQNCPAYVPVHETSRSYASIVRQQAASKPNQAVKQAGSVSRGRPEKKKAKGPLVAHRKREGC